MEGMERRSARQESPKQAAEREMIAAAQRTLSGEGWAAFEAALASGNEEEMRERIAAFNELGDGTPDSEETLAEREGDVTIALANGRELRIERSKRGTFTLSSPGLH